MAARKIYLPGMDELAKRSGAAPSISERYEEDAKFKDEPTYDNRYDRGGGMSGDNYQGGQYGGQQSRDSRQQQQVKDSRYGGDMEVYTGPSSRQTGERGAAMDYPMVELNHLATFTISSRQGKMSPEEGIQKLRQMDETTGIWTMKVDMIIEPKNLVVLEKTNQEEIERFPIAQLSDVTAVTNRQRRDVYNNIVLFTLLGETLEMHIFQCLSKSAQSVVDDILAAQQGKVASRQAPVEQSRPRVTDKLNEREEAAAEVSAKATAAYKPSARREVQNSGASNNDRAANDVGMFSAEKSDNYIMLLNRCFDDIEKYVARLQMAADAFRELEQRRNVRAKGGRNAMGDGMLTMRSRPPPAKDFIDILQKFKLAFNLLARLKGYIHDPNAPELVHFLFTPLLLIIEASRDSVHGTVQIPEKVIAPLLTADALDLLHGCMTSKERDLLKSLGDAWTVSKEDWRGYVPPFFPRFYDGFQPPPAWFDETGGLFSDNNNDSNSKAPIPRATAGQRTASSAYNDENGYSDRYRESLDSASGREDNLRARSRDQNDPPRLVDNMRLLEVRGRDNSPAVTPAARRQYSDPFSEDDPAADSKMKYTVNPIGETSVRDEPDYDGEYSANRRRGDERPSQGGYSDVGRQQQAPPLSAHQQQQKMLQQQQQALMREANNRELKAAPVTAPKPLVSPVSAGGSMATSITSPSVAAANPYDDEQTIFNRRLVQQGMTVAEAISMRESKAPQELTVKKGEVFEVIDKSRNWWKLRNSRGEIGHAPNTILQVVSEGGVPMRHQPMRAMSDAGLRPLSVPEYNTNGPPPSELAARHSIATDPRGMSSEVTEHTYQGIKLTGQSQVNTEFESQVMRTGPQPSRVPSFKRPVVPPGPAINITQRSGPREVLQWLQHKGFSEWSCQRLMGVTGHDLFQLTRAQLEQILGRDEGDKLDSQLKVQKAQSGYEDQQSQELDAILQLMRKRSSVDGST